MIYDKTNKNIKRMLILVRCIQGWDVNVFLLLKKKTQQKAQKIISKIVQNHKIYLITNKNKTTLEK